VGRGEEWGKQANVKHRVRAGLGSQACCSRAPSCGRAGVEITGWSDAGAVVCTARRPVRSHAELGPQSLHSGSSGMGLAPNAQFHESCGVWRFSSHFNQRITTIASFCPFTCTRPANIPEPLSEWLEQRAGSASLLILPRYLCCSTAPLSESRCGRPGSCRQCHTSGGGEVVRGRQLRSRSLTQRPQLGTAPVTQAAHGCLIALWERLGTHTCSRLTRGYRAVSCTNLMLPTWS
jgi:hypothetical protein